MSQFVCIVSTKLLLHGLKVWMRYALSSTLGMLFLSLLVPASKFSLVSS